MKDLTKEELQIIVLMTGSKKGLGQYLGLEAKELNALWERMALKSPTDYVRAMDAEVLTKELLVRGSLSSLADKYGVSSSFLKGHLHRQVLGKEPAKVDATLLSKWVQENLPRYMSVRLATRMFLEVYPGSTLSESALRKSAEEAGMDMSVLLDWSFSNHSAGKGRRAELEFAKMRGSRIKEDCNKTQGSQAPYDFLDEELGKVNVKSSRRYRYKASTRRSDPFYWKFSTSSLEQADHCVVMCYDEKMRVFIGYAILKPEECGTGKTMTITQSRIRKPR